MTIYFEDLDKTRDWSVLVEGFALAGASAFVKVWDPIKGWNPGTLVDLYRDVRETITK